MISVVCFLTNKIVALCAHNDVSESRRYVSKWWTTKPSVGWPPKHGSLCSWSLNHLGGLSWPMYWSAEDASARIMVTSELDGGWDKKGCSPNVVLTLVVFLGQILGGCLAGNLDHGDLLVITGDVARHLTQAVISVPLHQEVYSWRWKAEVTCCKTKHKHNVFAA